MPRTSRGLYVFTRHSADCKYQSEHGETDRTANRRCHCMKYIAGTAPDGAKIRESANTTSWERAQVVATRARAARPNEQSALRAGKRRRCRAAATTAAAEDGGRGRAPIPRNQARGERRRCGALRGILPAPNAALVQGARHTAVA